MTFAWLDEAAVVAIHAELLAEHGGRYGMVDRQLLSSTLTRPKNKLVYENPEPDLPALAAAYGYGFSRNHCFTDGNKRIALAAIAVFLRMNGLRLAASEADTVAVMETLARNDMAEQDLARWIRGNSRPVQDKE